jgi:hypothetical protein
VRQRFHECHVLAGSLDKEMRQDVIRRKCEAWPGPGSRRLSVRELPDQCIGGRAERIHWIARRTTTAPAAPTRLP